MATRTRQQLGSVDAGWDESTQAISPQAQGPERRRVEEETTTMAVEELDALLESAGSGCEGATASLSAGEMDDLLDSVRPGTGLRQGASRGGGGGRGAPPAGETAAGGGIGIDEEEVGAAFDALEGSFSEWGAAAAPAGGAPPLGHEGALSGQPHASFGEAPPPIAAPPYALAGHGPATFAPAAAPFAYAAVPVAPGALAGDGHAATRDSTPTVIVAPEGDPAMVAIRAWGAQAEPATVELRSWPAMAQPGTPQVAAGALPATPPGAPQASGWPSPHAVPGGAMEHYAPAAIHAPSPPRAPIVDEPSLGEQSTRRARTLFFIALSVGGTILCALTVYLVLRRPTAPPAPTAATAASPSRPAAAPMGKATSGAAMHGEAEARDALRRLAEGVRTCARDIIEVLPGTSEAVPRSLRLMKDGVYSSLPREYRSPVFSCTRYQEDTPQPFQIQWQVAKGSTEGMAVAWLDADGDGQADRALGVRVTLVKRREVELGEIEVLDPVPPVAATPAR